LLTVSQMRSQALIELLYRKALVAAKAWVSLYPRQVLLSIQCAAVDPAIPRSAALHSVLPVN